MQARPAEYRRHPSRTMGSRNQRLAIYWRLGMSMCLVWLLAGCASSRPAPATEDLAAIKAFVADTAATPALGPDSTFAGSPYPDVGLTGLFATREPEDCQVAVLSGGEDSFAVRMQTLRNARESIRIQALVFLGDESGLQIAEVLKQKKAEGLDVRVIVDAFSNPWLQTQWMFFDLKQHGIEVEGYEALALQWLNELPVPFLSPHYDPERPDKRFHEKMWIIDGETEHRVAVTGGLNIGNPYFRVDPEDPDANWRDQDVVVRGAVIEDMVTAFDRNFEYLVGIKESRGILNTNLYWDGTRALLDHTGKFPVHYSTDPQRLAYVEVLESREPDLVFRGATCRFLQNRPRMAETYIQQAYLKLIEQAEREVLIANAYFIPTPSILTALKDAAERCIAVTVVSNSPATNDLPEISLVGRGYYAELLAVNESPAVAACEPSDAGLQIWEWVGHAADEEAQRQGTMHSKFAVIDGRISLVGSYNLDPRSERLNSETALVFEQRELAQTLRALLLESDLRYSRRVTSEQAETFKHPDDVLLQMRKSIGQAFEEEL